MPEPDPRRHALEALGLDPTTEPLDRGTIDDPSPLGLSRGYVATTPDLAVMEFSALPDSLRFDAHGWSLAASKGEDGAIVVSAEGLRLERQTPDLLGLGLCDEEGAVVLEVGRFRGGAMLRGELTTCDLIVTPAEGGRLGWEFHPGPSLSLPPVPHLTSDVWEWVAGESPWLIEAVASLLASGEPYDHLAAAGLAARLRASTPAERKETLEAVLAGTPINRVCPAREWALSLESEALDYLERAALIEADRVQVDLASAAAFDPDGNESGLILRELLLARDRLQGVVLLLETASPGSAEAIRSSMAVCDRQGEAIARTTPPFPQLADDPQLERVAELESHLWWTRLGG